MNEINQLTVQGLGQNLFGLPERMPFRAKAFSLLVFDLYSYASAFGICYRFFTKYLGK